MSTAGFVHDALLYRDDDGFTAGVVPFLAAAIAAGGGAFAVVPRERGKAIQDALGDQVRVLDMAEVGGNPSRLIPAVQELVDAVPGRPVHGVGEPVGPWRTAVEQAEVLLHEALVNLAFEQAAGLRLRCPYDVAGLGEDVIASARRSHPVLVEGERESASADYDAGYAADVFAGSLPQPDSVVDMTHFTLDDLPEVRDLVTARAGAFGLTRDRALDLALATNEVVTNSVVHGGERGTLRVWHDDDTLVCEVSDGGHITELLVGRIMPLPSVRGGRGVWLANQLCDVTQIRSTADSGTVVRLHMRR